MKYILFIISCLFVLGCSSVRIIDRPIIFDENRIDLTLEYLEDRYGLEQNNIEIVPKMIVLHWTFIPTLEESYDYFNKSQIAGTREYVKGVSGLNVSSHFLVSQEGHIYRLMPENHMARHVIGLNHCAIGIENVGGTEETPLTKAQLRSNIWLVKKLASTYNIDYLIGHYEYTHFVRHELWLEKDSAYRTLKTDPGKDFMYNVRKATKNLNFKPIPKELTQDEIQTD